MNNYIWIVALCIMVINAVQRDGQKLESDVFYLFKLKHFGVTLCTDVNVDSYFDPSISDHQTSVYCPYRTVLHILDAIYSPVQNENSFCSKYSDSKYSDLTLIKQNHLSECSPRSIGQIVKRICDGKNKCDIINQLKKDNITVCLYPSILQVNYTCLPVYSKREVICADSYVELSCKDLSADMGLLILEAMLNYNVSLDPTLTNEQQLQICAKTGTNDIPCPTVDSVSIISDKSALLNQISCAKSYLYLKYTCVHNVLLEIPRPIANSKKSEKHREKYGHKSKKRLNRPGTNISNNLKLNNVDVAFFNDDLGTYSGQTDGSNIQTNPLDHTLKSSSATVNDDIINALNELSVSPKTKSAHFYLSALLPAMLCIVVSCIFVVAILCHRRQLFKRKLKSNNICRTMHSPVYCNGHISCNMTVDNKHENDYQSNMQMKLSQSNHPIKKCIPKWTDERNFISNLQQTDCSISQFPHYCPGCNHEQKETSEIFHYQNISYGDDINNDTNPSVKASPNSSSRMPSTENSFSPNCTDTISKIETVWTPSTSCFTHGLLNTSLKHYNHCNSPYFNHSNNLIYANYNTCLNNSNSKQNTPQICIHRSGEQVNGIISQQLSPNRRPDTDAKTHYDENSLVQNLHDKLHDRNTPEQETTAGLHRKFPNVFHESERESLCHSGGQINCKTKYRLAPPLFSSGDDLLPGYMMNTKSPLHQKCNAIPVVRYPYDSDDETNDDDSDSDVNLDNFNHSDNLGNKPDICLTASKATSDKKHLVSTSPMVNMLSPMSHISRTMSDHRVQNPVSPSLMRSITSQGNHKSTSVSENKLEPFSRNRSTGRQVNLSSDKKNSEVNLCSSPSINTKNRCYIYDCNNLSVDDNFSRSMCGSVQQ
uniref:SUEL-type lectin domain-containing protein n=1 Tax=Trichobilharzia regenti TaxID=157069 RepID=A0AA85JAL0_TRIRE|nr:unnamed protein product [Trichobilharzia regenti]